VDGYKLNENKEQNRTQSNSNKTRKAKKKLESPITISSIDSKSRLNRNHISMSSAVTKFYTEPHSLLRDISFKRYTVGHWRVHREKGFFVVSHGHLHNLAAGVVGGLTMGSAHKVLGKTKMYYIFPFPELPNYDHCTNNNNLFESDADAVSRILFAYHQQGYEFMLRKESDEMICSYYVIGMVGPEELKLRGWLNVQGAIDSKANDVGKTAKLTKKVLHVGKIVNKIR